MPDYKLQVTLWPTDNVPENVSTNTFSCLADDLTAAELFKDAVIGEYQSMVARFPEVIRQNNHVWKIYDRGDPAPIYPASEGTFNFPTAPTGGPLPTEVALCMSFQALITSGIPQARRRGRVYFGPLKASDLAAGGRPSATLVSALDTFGTDLLAASNAAATWTWGVYSETASTFAPIANGWVDDEFDTQRRRGRVLTTRTVFP